MTDETSNDPKPGDVLPPDNPNAAQDVCPRCGGEGKVDGARCEDCKGTGTVSEPVGGG